MSKTVYLNSDNTVREIIPDYALPVEKWYGAEFASMCVEAPDEVESNWSYNKETGLFSAPNGTNTNQEMNYIPSPEQSSVSMMRAAFSAQLPSMDDDTIIQCSGLAPDWAPGNHTVGEVYNTRNGVHADGPEWEQTWECFQAHDNEVYPDIKPGNPAWFTFWRPLHGTSPETARPWVAPMGAHDLYKAGEYMVWTDNEIYKAVKQTNFSPEDQPDAWEKYQSTQPKEPPSDRAMLSGIIF